MFSCRLDIQAYKSGASCLYGLGRKAHKHSLKEQMWLCVQMKVRSEERNGGWEWNTGGTPKFKEKGGKK